jgi:hypothetical protein
MNKHRDTWAGLSLAEYIETLLRQGKRSDHDDFKVLMDVWGRDKIVALAKDVLARIKSEETVGGGK